MLNYKLFPFCGQIPMMVYSALKLNLAEKLMNRSLTVHELCEGNTVRSDKLQRVLLALESFGYFQFDNSTSKWSNTNLSTQLTLPQDRGLGQWMFNPMIYEVLSKTYDSLFVKESSADLFYKAPLFEMIKARPEHLAEFHEMLQQGTKQAIDDILNDISFDGISSILDVGGGTGAVIAGILKKYPHIKGGVLEREEVIPAIKSTASNAQVNIEAIQGDFFEAVPREYDCIMVMQVLHNWNDEKCLTILKNCRAALEHGKEIMIIDTLLDPTSPFYGYQRHMDIIMLCLLSGAKERTEEEFRDLLSQSGFRYQESRPVGHLSITKAIAN